MNKRYTVSRIASVFYGGESGIRTHGTLPYDGFQDRSVITTSVSLRMDDESIIAQRSAKVKQFLKKIEQLELEGKFDVDAEDDPPTIVLTPENIDYLRTTMTSKIKRIFANEVGERFLDNLLKNNKLISKFYQLF